MGDIVPVTKKSELDPLQIFSDFPYGKIIRKGLTWMEEIGQSVNHRD
jgi:hypothetical protein